jgi:hypothetical protein
MVCRRISNDLKYITLELWEAGWDLNDIMHVFHVSRASLFRWRALFDKLGTLEQPAPICRCTCIIGHAVLQACKNIFMHSPKTYLDELQWYLAIEHDIAISISALQASLVRAGLTRKLMRKIAVERDEECRAEWKHTIQSPEHFLGTGKEFVCIDKSAKDERKIARNYGRSISGEPAETHTPFIRGIRYSLVAALSTHGYIVTSIYEGALDQYNFFDFIVDDVVSTR